MFGYAILHNVDYSRSDHRPIMMSFGDSPSNEVSDPFILRFQARWLKQASFSEVVEGTWEASLHQVQSNDLAGRLAMVHKRAH
jgi:hypothetical protein